MVLSRTHRDDPRFHTLVLLLDADLAGRYGDGNVKYTALNTLQKITGVVLALEDGEPAGCGAFKPYGEGCVEIKRVFVHPGFRGRGLARRIMAELEAWALETGCQRAVLETGVNQREAISLYESIGYRRIDNFGPYAYMAESLCYEKNLLHPAP